MKYKVLEIYTPDDTQSDRSRKTAEFESESTNIVELAEQARIACSNNPTNVGAIRQLVKESADQLEGQDINCFEIILFSNSGEWSLEVEKVS